MRRPAAFFATKRTQRETAMKTLSLAAITAFASVAVANFASAQAWQESKFQVSSTTFKNNSILPITAIQNIAAPNGSNGCSINGAPGGNESPELSWTDVPRGTASFVVITFDTLGFTHWGMYNIPPTITKLPENAGVAGSAYGQQVVNVFGDISYGGPCPPRIFPRMSTTTCSRFTLSTKSSNCSPRRISPPLRTHSITHW